jgi:hypothetical protein
MFPSVLDVSAHKPKDTILRVVGLEGVVIYSLCVFVLRLEVPVENLMEQRYTRYFWTSTLILHSLARGVAALVIMFMYFRVNIVIQWMPYASISF